MGGLRGTGAAAPLSPPRPFLGLVRGRRGGLGRGAGVAVFCGRGGWLLGTTEASLPPGRRGLVTQVDWGTLEYGALPTFLQVRRRPGRQRRQFEEEGAKSFCTQK